MDKDLAASLLGAAIALDKSLGEMDEIVGKISDPDLRRRYAGALGDVMGGIAQNFIFPIVREYPDLNPDR